MEENLHNDDHLESFFKNSFEHNDDPIPSGDWDTPSNAIWDKIEQELPEEPARKVFYLPRLLAGVAAILLFLLGGLSVFLYFQNRNLTRIIEQQNQIVNEVSGEKNTAPVIPSPQSQGKQPITPQSTQKLNSIEAGNETIPSPNTPSKMAKNTIQSSAEKGNNFINKVKEIKDTSSLNTLPPSHLGSNNKNIALIPSLQPTFITPNRLGDISTQFMPPKFPSSADASDFFVGIFVDPSYSDKKVIAKSPNSSLPFRGQEMTKITTGWGIKAGVHLNDNWDVLMGIAQTSHLQIQHRRLSFNHESTNEYSDNNEYVSSYSLSISSSLGESDAAVDIARPNNHPLNDRTLPLSITLRQKISFLNIPLIVKYNKKIGHFSLSASGGLALGFLTGFKSNMQVQSLRHNFRARPIRRLDTPTFDHKTSINLVAGIGLAYAANEHLSLAIEPQIQKNIRPFIQNDHFQSSFYTAGIQMGAYWNF